MHFTQPISAAVVRKIGPPSQRVRVLLGYSLRLNFDRELHHFSSTFPDQSEGNRPPEQSSKKAKEVVSAAAADAGDSVAATNDASDFDDLTLDDLSALFKSFQQLDEENRTSLLEYMRNLEKNNPTRMRQIREHMNRNR